MEALKLKTTADVDRLEMSAVTAVESSETMHTGALANAEANVRVQEVVAPVPTLMIPEKSVELASIVGEVPQELTEGIVPLDTRCPLF